MNQNQRKTLEALKTRLDTLDATMEYIAMEGASKVLKDASCAYYDARVAYSEIISCICSDVEEVKEEEEEKFNNLSEGLQQGDNGQKMEQCVDVLDTAVQALKWVVDTLTQDKFGFDEADKVDREIEEAIGNIDECK